ncbi:hypothetical protein CCYA_CCYA19G4689 [Cyanidiococcus yangmingshanensis]|nr:hypothetical protein CCYA_CCYA19G4689 [Cyanidiococcus yangmingshanensis]
MTNKSSLDEEAEPSHRSAKTTYQNLDQEWGFATPTGTMEHVNYMQQYSQLYFCRLVEMRNSFERACHFDRIPVSQLPSGQVSWVVGIIFKQMPMKPTVLKSYADDIMLPVPELRLLNYTSDSDRVFVEDESGRIECIFTSADHKHELVTGMVVALQGTAREDGYFYVDLEQLPPVCAPVPRPWSENTKTQYVCFVSGVNVSAPAAQLFLDYVTGCMRVDLDRVRSLTRIVIAGNLRGDRKLIDAYLTTLASRVPVDLMPGAEDPANAAFPQQPWHRILLPQATAVNDSANRLVRCSNPHAFTVNHCLFLGTSGQNVENICRFSRITSSLDALERLLESGHLAPTAPDTIACTPQAERDPLVLRQTPHVFFAGNTDGFGCRKLILGGEAQTENSSRTVTLLSIPRFELRETAVLLALPELVAVPLHF